MDVRGRETKSGEGMLSVRVHACSVPLDTFASLGFSLPKTSSLSLHAQISALPLACLPTLVGHTVAGNAHSRDDGDERGRGALL